MNQKEGFCAKCKSFNKSWMGSKVTDRVNNEKL
jgi:hypothetical protein